MKTSATALTLIGLVGSTTALNAHTYALYKSNDCTGPVNYLAFLSSDSCPPGSTSFAGSDCAKRAIQFSSSLIGSSLTNAINSGENGDIYSRVFCQPDATTVMYPVEARDKVLFQQSIYKVDINSMMKMFNLGGNTGAGATMATCSTDNLELVMAYEADVCYDKEKFTCSDAGITMTNYTTTGCLGTAKAQTAPRGCSMGMTAIECGKPTSLMMDGMNKSDGVKMNSGTALMAVASVLLGVAGYMMF